MSKSKPWQIGTLVVKDPTKHAIIKNVEVEMVGGGGMGSGHVLVSSGSGGGKWERAGKEMHGHMHVPEKMEPMKFVHSASVDVDINGISVADLTNIFLDRVTANQEEIKEFNKALGEL